MSWNGTVYCSYCGRQGHNRRSCADLKDYVKENPDSYMAQRVRAVKSASKSRSCSYCHEVGHTRRKCEMKNNDIAEFVERNKKMAQEVAVWLKEEGIEPGALIETNENDWDADTKQYVPRKYVYMIAGVDYERMNIETMHTLGDNWSNAQVMKMRRIDRLSDSYAHYYELPHHSEWNNMLDYRGRIRKEYKVISKVKSCTAYPSDMPANFLTGELGVAELFDAGKHNQKRNRFTSVRVMDQHNEVLEKQKSEKSENNFE